MRKISAVELPDLGRHQYIIFVSERADELYEVRRHGDFPRHEENFQFIGMGKDGIAVDTLLMIAEDLHPECVGQSYHHIDEVKRYLVQRFIYKLPVFFGKIEVGFPLIRGAEDIVDDGTGEHGDKGRFLFGVPVGQVLLEPLEKDHLDDGDPLSQDRHQSAFKFFHHTSSGFAAPLSPIPLPLSSEKHWPLSPGSIIILEEKSGSAG